MEFFIVRKEEFFDVMQHVNLVKVKFNSDDTWVVAPILYTAQESIDIILDSERKRDELALGEKVVLKFQSSGCEYIVGGEILEISSNYHTTVTIGYATVQKYYNMRKHRRFETDLKVGVTFNSKQRSKSLMKNISRGGAMIVAEEDIELNSIANIQATFPTGNSFTAAAKIIRKAPCATNSFSYGVQFIGMPAGSSKVINKVIARYEREYLKSLHMLRQYNKKRDMYFDTRITVFSYDPDESYEIRELLVKLGAENFEVFQDFKFHADFLTRERPKIIVVETSDTCGDVNRMVANICRDFPQIHVVMVVPMESTSKNSIEENTCSNMSVLYKPLICNEFEQEMLKYL